MNILYLSKERDIDLEKDHNIMYLDYTSKIDGKFPLYIFNQIKAFKPNLLLEREFNDQVSRYSDLVEFTKYNFPKCKTAVWLIDSHCNLDWHLEYAPKFDYAFIAISRYVPIIAAHLRSINSQTKCFWLPLCYPYRADKIKRNKSRVPFDIVFIGRWGAWFDERNRLLELLEKHYGERMFRITDYSNMEKYLRQGIISFNRSVSDDMNFRVFETMANGLELVTNDVMDLHLIKDLDYRINVYHNDEELIKICDDILDGTILNDVIKTQIWIQNHHCLIHRHNAILNMIHNDIQETY